MEKVDVTILMPCLNEAKTLPVCIESAREALKELKKQGLAGEILISDNGSTDGSQEIAKKSGCRVEPCPRRGYGNTLLYGIRAARGQYIVMGDSDASYDFQEAVPMVMKLMEGYELVMGSRLKGKILPRAMPWKNRYLGTPLLTGLLNLFFSSRMSDVNCGLRAFTKRAFQKMRLVCPGMEFASEMVVRATLLGLKRTEVPITFHPDQRGRPPHLNPWRDGLRHLRFLLMYGPLWLFFAPGIFLLLFSLAIFMGLLGTPPDQTFGFGELRFGDHWLVLCGGLFAMGFQILALGMIALRYRIERRHVPPNFFYRHLYGILNLKNSALLGLFFILLSWGLIGYVFWQWSRVHFEALYRVREMVIATTLLSVGLQTYFNLLLELVLENDRRDLIRAV